MQFHATNTRWPSTGDGKGAQIAFSAHVESDHNLHI